MLIGGLRGLVVFLALLISGMLSADLLTQAQGLLAYTLVLLGYLYAESRSLRTRVPQYYWMNPVILASIFTFVMAFGVTNVLYFMPADWVSRVGVGMAVTPWMNRLMLLVVLSACAMWLGYSSGVGRTLGWTLHESRVLRTWLSPSIGINRHVLYVCVMLSLLVRLLEIKLGIYGYSSTYGQVMAGASYHQVLHLAELSGKLALLGLAIQCFGSSRPSLRDRFLLVLVLGYEVVFGFLVGLKSAVIMPFIIVSFGSYSQRNRFPRWLIPAVAVGVVAAYAVIEPFRVARYRDAGFEGTSLTSIATTMVNARGVQASMGRQRAGVGLQFLARMNMTYYAAKGIEYAATHRLSEDCPDFRGDLLLAPLHAVIPRFLWSSKPIQQSGFWYTVVVLGKSVVSSSALTPFVYLNFAGGPLVVILAFFFVGVVQRGLFDGLRHFGCGGLIVILGLLKTLSDIDSSFNAVIISIIRFFPLLVMAQYVLLRRPRRQLSGERERPDLGPPSGGTVEDQEVLTGRASSG